MYSSLIAVVALVSPAMALWPQPLSVETGQGTLGSSQISKFRTIWALTTTTANRSSKAVLPATWMPSSRSPCSPGCSLTWPGTKAKITSKSSFGTLHAVKTFAQLFYAHSSDASGVYNKLAPVKIADKPKFSHRGVNLDVARNFFPIKDLECTIDALSMNKFNVLHLHMTDSQSWPIEIPALPQLAQNGAYAPNHIYFSNDIQHIQQYGLSRGVAVYIGSALANLAWAMLAGGKQISLQYAMPNHNQKIK
ncbi:hypothetical protein VHEMI07693 [[Torrubiella] hemipterigena]|uniref:beta-N-acetylhexosaminidase n=1 Tax=[Torrubiella] hemipterigena TaxID=1531966 RepID=A0A0A1TM36_9HYPO|nr:hypothetical protein VHEMI07693 [[Torrubiella] hemipterigena]